MGTVLLILVVVLVVAGLVFGVASLLSGDDPGLSVAEPDGRAVPLPSDRSLQEGDLKSVRFDVGWRGYRMAQVDRVLRRTAYDVGYKEEMIAVLEAEVTALREGRSEDAELLRKARESAASPAVAVPGPAEQADVDVVDPDEAPSEGAEVPMEAASDASEAVGAFVEPPETTQAAEPAGTSAEPAGASTEPAGTSAEPAGASTEVVGATTGSDDGGGGEDAARVRNAAEVPAADRG
jgi:DivIVA domain-containing protein